MTCPSPIFIEFKTRILCPGILFFAPPLKYLNPTSLPDRNTRPNPKSKVAKVLNNFPEKESILLRIKRRLLLLSNLRRVKIGLYCTEKTIKNIFYVRTFYA